LLRWQLGPGGRSAERLLGPLEVLIHHRERLSPVGVIEQEDAGQIALPITGCKEHAVTKGATTAVTVIRERPLDLVVPEGRR
jgi:hypothetical protein